VLSDHREGIDRVVAWFGRPLVRLGVHPNHVTGTALLVTAVGALLVATGHLVSGAAVAGLGSLMDLLDGVVARLGGNESDWGGYLDSLSDRFTEGILFLAVGWYYQVPWIWATVLVAFLGSVATSYARARVHEDVDASGVEWSDLAERGERLLVLLFPVGFQGLADLYGPDVEFLPWVVVLLAVVSHVTVLQRAARARRLLGGGS
jgi:phosphatidylglycerophosphate synthase